MLKGYLNVNFLSFPKSGPHYRSISKQDGYFQKNEGFFFFVLYHPWDGSLADEATFKHNVHLNSLLCSEGFLYIHPSVTQIPSHCETVRCKHHCYACLFSLEKQKQIISENCGQILTVPCCVVVQNKLNLKIYCFKSYCIPS